MSEGAENSSEAAETAASNVSFAEALASRSIELPDDVVAGLDRYCQALWSWNQKLNLTRHTDYDKFVGRDLVDTLTLAKFLEPGQRVLDVGSGGGVPGAVLAILRPDLKVTLSESVGKKANALRAVVAEAKVNAAVHHGRAEDLLAKGRYDSLVIRAVAPLTKLLTWFAPHWPNIGQLLLIKGPAWVEERGLARHLGQMHGLKLRKLAEYPIPGGYGQSVVLQITVDDTAGGNGDET